MKTYLLTLLLAASLHAYAGPDEVRISALNADSPATKTLTGKEAARVVKAFNRLPWDQTHGKRCHIPGFRIEELSHDVVTLDATICFGCNNVRFAQPVGRGLQGFDASQEAAKQCLAVLSELFPKR